MIFKFTFFLLIIISFSSCLKKRSCECTTTLSAQGYLPYDKKTIVPIDKSTTAKSGKSYCDHTSRQMTASTRQLYSSWVEVSSRCKLVD